MTANTATVPRIFFTLVHLLSPRKRYGKVLLFALAARNDKIHPISSGRPRRL
jgi:hypothetical protein